MRIVGHGDAGKSLAESAHAAAQPHTMSVAPLLIDSLYQWAGEVGIHGPLRGARTPVAVVRVVAHQEKGGVLLYVRMAAHAKIPSASGLPGLRKP